MSRGDRFLVYLPNNDVNTMAYDVIYDTTTVLYLVSLGESCSILPSNFTHLRMKGENFISDIDV